MFTKRRRQIKKTKITNRKRKTQKRDAMEEKSQKEINIVKNLGQGVIKNIRVEVHG
jgi:hypothetical protein